MTLSPLLQEFFYYNCTKERAIRVHCPSDKEAVALGKLAEGLFPGYCGMYLHKKNNENHRYFFWDYHLLEDVGYGFNAYNHGNGRTYEFEDFIKEAFIIEDEDETNISDVEELL